MVLPYVSIAKYQTKQLYMDDVDILYLTERACSLMEKYCAVC